MKQSLHYETLNPSCEIKWLKYEVNHNYEIKSLLHEKQSHYYEIKSQNYEILTHNYETKSTLWHTTVGHSETTDIKTTEIYEILS